VVTHQLQVERRTAKAHRPKTDALPLDHVTNVVFTILKRRGRYKYTCTITAPVIGSVDRSPDLQVNGLRSTSAGRVDVPADDEAVAGDLLRRIDD